MYHWDKRGPGPGPVDPLLTAEYSEKELNCTGCMGPCGKCDEPARTVLPGINVPWQGESWDDLNKWRKCYGLAPVEKDWNLR